MPKLARMPFTPRLQARKEIDSRKWDEAIAASPGASLYGFSETLDHLCEDWDGLIMGDYQAVMPVPWRRKFGIRYAFTPAFIQRLDVYGADVTEEIRITFLRTMKELFRYADVDLAFKPDDKNLVQRINYTRDLSGGISAIHSSYTNDAVRSLRKAAARSCVYSHVISVSEVIALYGLVYGKKAGYTTADYKRLSTLAEIYKDTGEVLLRAVRHRETNDVLFGALFFLSAGRIYYLLGAPSAKGRTARAGYFLIDSVMREFAGSNLVFDFEGSDIPSVAAFYRNFGPDVENYYHLHHNRLPWLIRLFKK